MFISFEGLDGVGKTTQMGLLVEYLDKLGTQYVRLREPGGTTVGDSLRTMLLSHYPNDDGPTALTETLLLLASRRQLIDTLIKPALDAGKVVLCDRYVDSTIAYQGYGTPYLDSINALCDIVVNGCMPDVTFYFYCDEDVRVENISTKTHDRIESRGEEYFKRVKEGFEYCIESDPNRFIKIKVNNGNKLRDIHDIHEEVVFFYNGLFA